MWLLVGFGYLRHLCTGEPMFQAIEGASIWVNPFLLVLFTIGFSWLISRRMGVAAGVFFALTFVTVPDIGWVFHPFRLGIMVSMWRLAWGLCCVWFWGDWDGSQQRPGVSDGDSGQALRFFRPFQLMGQKEARRYFIAAGVFTGLGLWIGATVQFFTIGAIACGSMVKNWTVAPIHNPSPVKTPAAIKYRRASFWPIS